MSHRWLAVVASTNDGTSAMERQYTHKALGETTPTHPRMLGNVAVHDAHGGGEKGGRMPNAPSPGDLAFGDRNPRIRQSTKEFVATGLLHVSQVMVT